MSKIEQVMKQYRCDRETAEEIIADMEMYESDCQRDRDLDSLLSDMEEVY